MPHKSGKRKKTKTKVISAAEFRNRVEAGGRETRAQVVARRAKEAAAKKRKKRGS